MALFSNYSLSFDGSAKYVAIGDVAPLQFEYTNSFSITAWIKTTDTNGYILSKMTDGAPYNGYGLGLAGGKLQFYLINNWTSIAIAVATVTAINNSWFSCAVTYDGSGTAAGVKLYLGGVLQSSTVVYDSLASSSVLTTAPVELGGRYSTNMLSASIDDVSVYNKVLSPAEVAAIHNGGNPTDLTVYGPTANLIGYWLMGDGDTYPTILDHSVSANNGTMTNMSAGDIVADSPRTHLATELAALTDNTSLLSYLGSANNQGGTTLLQATNFDPSLETLDAPGAGAAPVLNYKMRALANPGPGYVTWVVTGSPDFTGSMAPSAIQAGTVVLTGSWT